MAERRDVVGTVLGFARTLRHAGVAASPDRVEAMLAAVGHLDVLDPTAVYWAGRLTLCGGPDDLDRYDAAFAAYFAGEVPRPTHTAGPPKERLSDMAPLETGSGEAQDDAECTADADQRCSTHSEPLDRVDHVRRGPQLANPYLGGQQCLIQHGQPVAAPLDDCNVRAHRRPFSVVGCLGGQFGRVGARPVAGVAVACLAADHRRSRT